MRDPGIHITESELAKILEQIWEGPPFAEKGWQKELATKIVRLAKNKTLTSRSVTISSELIEKRVKKQLRANVGDTKMMADLIYKIRYRRGHRGIAKIKEGSAEYTKIKGLVEVCIQFCQDYELGKKEGFTIYLTLGLQRISSSLNIITKLVNMAESISQIYQDELLIKDDNNKAETLEIIKYYSTLIVEQTGMVPNIESDPRKMARFVEVRKVTDEIDIPHQIYIDAQFQGLKWTDSYPEPNQLIGDKAIERVNKYMFENKIRKEKAPSGREDIKSRLKKLGR